MVPESRIRTRSRLLALVRTLCAAVEAAFWKLTCGSRASAGRATGFGEYTLGEKLGEGGMGVVYKAEHPTLRRPVAVKLLPAERASAKNVERFQREVLFTSRLTHANTIDIYGSGRAADGTFYYAMEYVDGVDLQTLVEREGPQAPARVAHLLAQLASALSEAHAAGLVHRDVKPANVMVCDRGDARDVVKVLDFGLIREVSRKGSDRDARGADAAEVVGTPLYMSPEAISAPENVDARSDVYAIGAVGYFLLTGAPPFSGKNVVEVCGHQLHSEPEPPSARRPSPIPRGLEALILRCLAKSPDARPASALELTAELVRFAADAVENCPTEWPLAA